MRIKIVFQLLAIFVLSILICGAVGLFVGMTVGGSFGDFGGGCVNIRGTLVCDEIEKGFKYIGQVGWEGGGLLGLHLGILSGIGVGLYIWKTRFKNKTR